MYLHSIFCGGIRKTHLFCNGVLIGCSRSSKVDDFGINWKRICDFLLVIHSSFGPYHVTVSDIQWLIGPKNSTNSAFGKTQNVLSDHGHLQGAAKKNDPTRKMWLLGNAWKFLRQIWQDCLAGLWPLMCWFCLNFLHVCKIGITPNFKFRFCNYTSLFVTWCYVPNSYCQIYWKGGKWAP